jgi:hypothetical protein
MSDAQNLAYAVVQVAHNFGAMAAVGGSLAAVKFRSLETRAKLARLALVGWITQGASGAAFGAVSYYFYRQLPELSEIAIAALIIKMACVAAGIALLGVYLLRGKHWGDAASRKACLSSLALAVTALSAAAFLRWFS